MGARDGGIVVYCKPCVHLGFALGVGYSCRHPNNMYETWLQPEPDKTPEEINENNDCKGYRKRRFGGSVRS